jgi:pimeloyl-ACP methyl ester carboxylesterase
MAKELVEVMDKLGLPTFALIGHDRGGRVSYRMAEERGAACRLRRDSYFRSMEQ